MMKKLMMLLLTLVLTFAMAGQALAFDDVAAADKAAVDKVAAAGIMQGYPDGSFKPNNTITRAEFAKVATLARDVDNPHAAYTQQLFHFSDLKEGAWYNQYIQNAANAGLMQGDAEGTFRPNDTVSLAEVYTVMLRMIGHNMDGEGNWPHNYMSKAAVLGAPVNGVTTAACNRGDVAKIVVWALDLNEKSDKADGVGQLAVATDVSAKELTVYLPESDIGRNLAYDTDCDWQIPQNEVEGLLIYIETDADGKLVSVSKADIKTNSLHEALITDEKIKLNGKSYAVADDAEIMVINSAGGVNDVPVEKLLESSYVASLRSNNYYAPIQYVLEDGKVSALLIGSYAGRTELHFGFIESYGEGADGTVVQFYGDDTNYLWDGDEEPQENKLYAYEFTSDGVDGYVVDVTKEEIKEYTAATTVSDICVAGGKQFIITDDTVIMEVEYNTDGTVDTVEYVDEIAEDDMVRVRYELKNNDTGIEAVYVLVDVTDR